MTMRPLPDGMTGAIMAFEGISDAVVLLHGPGGCRIRHAVHSSAVFHREQREWDSSRRPYFYGYPRVPATYLDGYDFINGASYKLDEAFPLISETGPALLAVVDSPGAGLIGDDHTAAIDAAGVTVPTVVMGESLASVPVYDGTDIAMTAVMEALGPDCRDTEEGTVNLLGLSILDKDWVAARSELEALLGDMGLRIISSPGAGSSVADLEGSLSAELNVVVCPEMCGRLREWYGGRGVGSVVSEAGAPVGFDATRRWVEAVADATGRDPCMALERIKRCERYVSTKFSDMRYSSARIKGSTFAVAAVASVARPLTEWLYGYLSMAPRAVCVYPGSDPGQEAALRCFLESVDYHDCWGIEPYDGVDFVLCDGITAETMELNGGCVRGVPIGHSTMGLDDMISRPVYGTGGALYILDEILHGVREG